MTTQPAGPLPAPGAIVHIVDDEEPTRKAMSRLLMAAGFEVRTYGGGDDFLARFERHTPGCIVLDMRLPGASGLDLQTVIAQCDNPLPIVFLTGHGEVRDSVRAIQRGAIDFLIKPADGTVLIDAVSRALVQDSANRAARTHLRSVRERYERLTVREREVFAHLISGQLNKQVAADLGISERTIKLHRARIFDKLQTDSIAALARIAIDLGVEPVRAPP
ncbi:MAG TPA: response regulator [Vicinamibacterales bacterium]|nr:response regulator [Vicinamibacterales bacterium]